MDEQANPLERDHCLSVVVLPGGLEETATVHGSKPVMDLLVALCASYHLTPSDYTVEILSPNKNNIRFKPNSPIGSLEAGTIVLKPKGMEEKIRRPPYMPEASVRLLINYNKSHKAVVRVNPRVPLEMLLPAVCDKCEFKFGTTVLLRDSESREPLDLTKTLNDHGLREVFAKDTAGGREPVDCQRRPNAPEAEVISPPPLQGLPKKKKQKENRGFLSLFRRTKKKPEMGGSVSGSASPGFNPRVGDRMTVQGVSSSDALQADMPKKRRAPQPPMAASQSVPNSLGACHLGGQQRSAELRSNKRRAPPPPCANTHQELQADAEVKESLYSLNTVEELREGDESDSVNLSPSSPPSPHPSPSSRPSFAYVHEVADPYPPSLRGKDVSDARFALAKVLTSSISKGTLVKCLRNSANFPKFHNGSARRYSDNGVFCAELESVRTPNLPTEPEWEDPVQRKGMATFKVVPSKKPKSNDPALVLDVLDQLTVEENPEREASLDFGKIQTETEDLRSPDTSETETPLPNPEPLSQQSQASDVTFFPPPLDLDSQDCPGSRPSEDGDTVEKQKEEEGPEATAEVIPTAPSDSSDGEHLGDGPIGSEDRSESVSTDMDKCGPYTDEEEVEEENFPPPPPPVFFNEDIEVMEEEREDATASSRTSSLPQSPTFNGQTMPDQSAAAPRPLDKMSAAPTRFAQAVALALQKSRGKGLGPQAGGAAHSTLPSPPRSTFQYGA